MSPRGSSFPDARPVTPETPGIQSWIPGAFRTGDHAGAPSGRGLPHPGWSRTVDPRSTVDHRFALTRQEVRVRADWGRYHPPDRAARSYGGDGPGPRCNPHHLGIYWYFGAEVGWDWSALDRPTRVPWCGGSLFSRRHRTKPPTRRGPGTPPNPSSPGLFNSRCAGRLALLRWQRKEPTGALDVLRVFRSTSPNVSFQ